MYSGKFTVSSLVALKYIVPQKLRYHTCCPASTATRSIRGATDHHLGASTNAQFHKCTVSILLTSQPTVFAHFVCANEVYYLNCNGWATFYRLGKIFEYLWGWNYLVENGLCLKGNVIYRHGSTIKLDQKRGDTAKLGKWRISETTIYFSFFFYNSFKKTPSHN